VISNDIEHPAVIKVLEFLKPFGLDHTLINVDSDGIISIDNVKKATINLLNENEIITVSDLLNSSEDSLLEIRGMDDSKLEEIYDTVQKFIERNQAEDEESPEESETSSSNEEEKKEGDSSENKES